MSRVSIILLTIGVLCIVVALALATVWLGSASAGAPVFTIPSGSTTTHQ